MDAEHQIVKLVYDAKEDNTAADELIKSYMGFIKAETAKFIRRIPIEGQDDELGISMMAFYESILSYDKSRGNFLKFAGRNIKNRLIDYYRKEKRHLGMISLNQPSGDEEDGELIDSFSDQKSETDERISAQATKEEIQEFAKKLAEFDISFSDVADNCPKQQRTLEACHIALRFSCKHPELLDVLLKTKKLPMAKLEEGAKISRKTLDRHRKYIVAIMLAFTNGYEIIRGHLHKVASIEGGDKS